jgi:hypothetical protein
MNDSDNAPVQQTLNIYLKNYIYMRKRAKELNISITKYINNLIEKERGDK